MTDVFYLYNKKLYQHSYRTAYLSIRLYPDMAGAINCGQGASLGLVMTALLTQIHKSDKREKYEHLTVCNCV